MRGRGREPVARVHHPRCCISAQDKGIAFPFSTSQLLSLACRHGAGSGVRVEEGEDPVCADLCRQDVV
eukprot:79583-Karenia_brevis.AAC.1